MGIGILSALLIGLIPEGLFTPGAGGVSDILIQALGGVIIAVALVLPGISASQMLYMLGIYESTLKAVGNMDIAALVPLAAGGLLGTFFLQKCWKGCWKNIPGPPFFLFLALCLLLCRSCFREFRQEQRQCTAWWLWERDLCCFMGLGE